MALPPCDWYVDANNGNDGRGGRSPGDPLQTLAGVNAHLNQITAGQKIGFARGGTYAGETWPDKPVTLQAYGFGAMPILDNTAGQPEPAVYVNASITIDGLHLKGGTASGRAIQVGQDNVTVTVRNCLLEAANIVYSGNANVTFVLDGNTFTAQGIGFYINGAAPSFVAQGNTFSSAPAGDNLYFFANQGFGTIDSDYNTFNPAGTIIRFRGPWDGTHHWTLAEWQAAGHDVHSTLIG